MAWAFRYIHHRRHLQSPELLVQIKRGEYATNVFGGGTLDVKAQNTSEAQALLTTLFRGAEYEQAAQTAPIKVDEIAIDDDSDEQTEQIVEAQIVPVESDSVAEYKKAKAEMARLGFETLDEYFDYVEFMKVKAKRNYATT